jgi:hypothetical protein
MVPGAGTNPRSGSSAMIGTRWRVLGRRDPLRERERPARGDLDHRLHQIDAVDHLGDRMLDLEAGVHLHEVEGASSPRSISTVPGAT